MKNLGRLDHPDGQTESRKSRSAVSVQDHCIKDDHGIQAGSIRSDAAGRQAGTDGSRSHLRQIDFINKRIFNRQKAGPGIRLKWSSPNGDRSDC